MNGLERRCVAVVPSADSVMEKDRCKAWAVEGSLRCRRHQHHRERLDNPDLYVVTLSFKPTRRNADGSYRRTIVGAPQTSREAADRYLDLNWSSFVEPRRKGERLRSATVEKLKDAVKKPRAGLCR